MLCGFDGFDGARDMEEELLRAILVGGFNPSEKILVSWDDYSQYMEKQKMFQTTNQHI